MVVIDPVSPELAKSKTEESTNHKTQLEIAHVFTIAARDLEVH